MWYNDIKEKNWRYYMNTEWLSALGTELSVSDWHTGSYNIFSVLGIEEKEVLICRFLGNLLDPNGSHGCGSLFLEQFSYLLESGGFPDDKTGINESKKAVIVLEECTDKNRRIDIVIHLPSKVYPIEVKVLADDQDGQLKDYHDYCKSDKIFYLTPTGWAPSERSKNGLKDSEIKCISFEKDIKNWLECCVEILSEDSRSSTIKPIIKQFTEVISHMSESSKKWKTIEKAVFENNDTDKQKSVFGILEYADNIRKRFQEDFIRTHIVIPDAWEFADPDGDNESPKHTVFKVVSKDLGNTLGYICVETNLYIFATKNAKILDDSKWKDTSTDRPWAYLTMPGSKNNINLRQPLHNTIDVFDPDSGKIDLDTYLEEKK